MGMKAARGIAMTLLTVGVFAACATLPVADAASTATYKNVHDVQLGVSTILAGAGHVGEIRHASPRRSGPAPPMSRCSATTPSW